MKTKQAINCTINNYVRDHLAEIETYARVVVYGGLILCSIVGGATAVLMYRYSTVIAAL